jgi:streptogramin lyase
MSPLRAGSSSVRRRAGSALVASVAAAALAGTALAAGAVDFTCDPGCETKVGSTVTFHATADAADAQFSWDLDGDGSFDDAQGADASDSYGKAGTYAVSVRALSAQYPNGADATHEVKVNPENPTPVPSPTPSATPTPEPTVTPGTTATPVSTPTPAPTSTPAPLVPGAPPVVTAAPVTKLVPIPESRVPVRGRHASLQLSCASNAAAPCKVDVSVLVGGHRVGRDRESLVPGQLAEIPIAIHAGRLPARGRHAQIVLRGPGETGGPTHVTLVPTGCPAGPPQHLTSIQVYRAPTAGRESAMQLAPARDGSIWFITSEETAATMTTGPAGPGTSIGRFERTADGPRFDIFRPTGHAGGLSFGASPRSITEGPDGDMWFVERDNRCGTGDYCDGEGHIGRITPGGRVTEFGLGTPDHPATITAGADRALYLLASGDGPVGNLYKKLGRVSVDGVTTPVRELSFFDSVRALVADPSGGLWFDGVWGFGHSAPDGTLLAAPRHWDRGRAADEGFGSIMTVGRGEVWLLLTDPDHVGWIESATPDQVHRTIPGPIGARPEGLAIGSDGRVWTLSGEQALSIGLIRGTTTYDLSRALHAVSGPMNAYPRDIVSGADGRLYFTEALRSSGDARGTAIGVITPAGGRVRDCGATPLHETRRGPAGAHH